MNIHQAQNEGFSRKLGPVTVTKAYPMKVGDSSAFMMVEDVSGKTALKIWGLPAHQCPKQGDVIVVVADNQAKSGIKNQEYPAGSGKFSLNANGCSLETSVGTGGAEKQSPQESHASPSNGPTGFSVGGPDKLPATMKRAAEGTKHYVDALVESGFSRDEALMLAQGSHSAYPLWWFGEKGNS